MISLLLLMFTQFYNKNFIKLKTLKYLSFLQFCLLKKLIIKIIIVNIRKINRQNWILVYNNIIIFGYNNNGISLYNNN